MLKIDVALSVRVVYSCTGFAVVFMCIAIPADQYAYVLPARV